MIERTNICRSITFCSNYIPANVKVQNWEYVTIGTIDGIIVSDNLIEKPDEPITVCIWEEQKKFQQRLQGEFTAQQIFIIRYDAIETEQKFWNVEKDYPFYFFCFCQVEGDKKSLWNNREKFEASIIEQADLKISTYLTYDNTDLFIVLKAREYNVGAGVINRMHQRMDLTMSAQKKVCLKNSYTVFAMNRKWLNDMDKAVQKDLNSQKISRVLISVMEQRNEDLEKVAEIISATLNLNRTEVNFTPILGESDDIVILNNVGWGDFIELCEKMFIKDNNFYETGAVASISTLLVVKINYCEDCRNKNGIIKISSESNGTVTSKEKYLSKIKELEHEYGIGKNGKHGELKIILNALPKFIGEVFNDYLFYSLLKPMEALLALTHKYDEFGNYNKEYYYEFINYLYIYIQTSNMSDKHTVQGLGFNSKIYDVPIKISAFYNAFLHQMTEILNVGNNCEYVFLTVPGMQFNVNVNELYPNASDEKRLILIKIPESSFYNIHDMMNILGHETAHYVGREFRNRRERLAYFVKSYAHLFIKYMHYMYLKNFNDYDLNDGILKELEKRISDLLIFGLEERRSSIVKENKSDIKVSIDYFAVLIPNIVYVMEKMIENDLEMALSPIGKNIEDETEARQIISNFREIAERFMHESNSHSTLVDSRSVLKMLHSLYEECFADVMSILILDISMEDYISCLVSEAEEQGLERAAFEKTDVMFRIGTVILCLYDLEDFSVGWKEEFDRGSLGQWKEIAENAIKTCYSEEKIYEEFETNVYAFIANNAIFKLLYHYLNRCVKNYNIQKNDLEMSKKIAEIQNIYHTFAGKNPFNGERQITEISKVIDEYKDYFWKNL